MTNPGAKPIRVLIVDDSAVVRGVLGRMVDAQEDMRVATTATNGSDALDALRLQEIDVVLLDIEMPVMDGLTALPLIVQRHPRASVLVTSSLTQQSASVTMRALALGAVDFVYKPSSRGTGIYGVEAAAAEVIAKIRAVARGLTAGDRGVDPAPHDRTTASRPLRVTQQASGDFEPQVLVLAASTGGPNALAAVVSALRSEERRVG